MPLPSAHGGASGPAHCGVSGSHLVRGISIKYITLGEIADENVKLWVKMNTTLRECNAGKLKR
jgi:hypothetical protein